MLHTKIRIPQSRKSSLVSRPELLNGLTEGLHVKLTTITAPAGYGKTTSLSEWAKQLTCKVSWLSLDQHDNDMVRFWSNVAATVRDETLDFGKIAPLISMGQRAYINFIDSFIHELQSYPEQLVLILDDYHVIELKEIHDSLAYLLEYLPAHVHIYVASRMNLPFPTARLKAKGEMRWITLQNLRFDVEDGFRLFQDCFEVDLSYEDVALLVNRTEGWVSALHLAAISLKRGSDPSNFIHEFSGRQRGIAQYLLEEVLSRQTDEMKSFLFQTSILTRMSASLCVAVTGQRTAQLLLEELDRQSLFISPLDEFGEWYRYHHLFADYLQQQFRLLEPERWEQAHIAASLWHEANHYPGLAVEHLMICGRYAEAVTLIENHLIILQDHRVLLLQWLETIPAAVLRTKPFIQLLYLKIMSELGKPHWSHQQLRNLEHELERPEWQPWLGAYYFLCAETALYSRSLAQSFKYLELYDIHEPRGSGSPLLMIAGNSMAAFSFETLLSFFDHLQDAEKYLSKCIRIWEKKESPFLGYIYCFYSELLIEWNRTDEAKSLLGRILYSDEWQSFTLIWFIATKILAGLLAEEKDMDNGFSLLVALENNLNVPDRELFMRRLHAEKANLYITADQLEPVSEWIRTCGLKHTDQVPSMYREYYIFARALIHVGQVEETIVLCNNIHRMTEQKNWLWDRFKALMLLIIALDKNGDEAEAMNKLEEALHLAEQNGFIRSFISEGKSLESLLVRYLRSRQSGLFSSSLPVSLQYVKKLLHKMNIKLDGEWDSPIHLTSQENRILHLVDKGLKNREIANQLGVSDETVKQHLKNIYQKLEAKSRIQAVNIAKENNLL